MKVYISADIEGITGATAWDEADPSKPDYAPLREQMLREVSAAIEGARAGGAEEIWVQDAHWHGRNLDPARLPRFSRLVRGWGPSPLCMVQELDQSFDALMLVGYHSPAGIAGNPLAHTMNPEKVHRLRINGKYASELLLHVWAAATLDVPTKLVTGDGVTCQTAESWFSRTVTVPVSRGAGDSTICIHPDEAVERIQAAAEEAASRLVPVPRLPVEFGVEIRFVKHTDAHKASHYPGCSLLDHQTIRFESEDWMEVMRMLLFTVW